MRKTLPLLLLSILPFLSCRKICNHHEEAKCRVETITTPELNATISYDEEGYPLSLTTNLDGSNSLDEFYKYDESRRLIRIDRDYPPIYYYYEGDSKLPSSNSILQLNGETRYEAFTYDDQGRIIMSEVSYSETPGIDTFKYYYDSNGNLNVGPEAISNGATPVAYTDKPSLYSLHPVWQLVSKNYSKNQFEGATFNDRGLPVALDFNASSISQSFGPILLLSGTTITYQCGASVKD